MSKTKFAAKRIGLLGGTFNPVHMGHLVIAQLAQEQFHLDQVIFVPVNQPHKSVNPLAMPQDRYEMLKLAIAGNKCFSVSDAEIKRGGKSYTVDTLRYFQKEFSGQARLHWIIGADALLTFSTWRDADEIRRLAKIIVVHRPGFKTSDAGMSFLNVDKPGIDISSSYLRNRLQHHRSVRYLVPDPVLKYIEKHELYIMEKKGKGYCNDC